MILLYGTNSPGRLDATSRISLKIRQSEKTDVSLMIKEMRAILPSAVPGAASRQNTARQLNLHAAKDHTAASRQMIMCRLSGS